MAFLPAPQPSRPQNVAMRVRDTDYSVFPTHTQVDMRKQQQESFEQMTGKLNGAVLDKHYRPFQRTMTDGERKGFTRCNGNIIAPGDIPYTPWQPKEYHTLEHLQLSLDVFGENEKRKAAEVAKMAQSKDYFTNFTKQPPHPHGKAMLHSPSPQREHAPAISGFKGLGFQSPEIVHGKAHGQLYPAHKKPPWLQDEAGPPQVRERRNPSMYSEGVSQLLGLGHLRDAGSSSSMMMGDASSYDNRSIEKGAAYPSYKSHKRIHHVHDSTGGHPSPIGARMPTREEGTTSQLAFYQARMEALSQSRAHTSMLP